MPRDPQKGPSNRCAVVTPLDIETRPEVLRRSFANGLEARAAFQGEAGLMDCFPPPWLRAATVPAAPAAASPSKPHPV